MNTITSGYSEYVSLADVKEELGISADTLNEIIKNSTPPIYTQFLYGAEYISLEAYKVVEAKFLKHNHKKATLRQAIGLIASWDCLTHDVIEQEIADKWTKYLNMKIFPADVLELVYAFVSRREKIHANLKRPDDDDFAQMTRFWSEKLHKQVYKEDVENLLGLFVEGKDFLESRITE